MAAAEPGSAEHTWAAAQFSAALNGIDADRKAPPRPMVGCSWDLSQVRLANASTWLIRPETINTSPRCTTVSGVA